MWRKLIDRCDTLHTEYSKVRFRFICHPVTASTMLYLVGLGLADETDISVKGLDVVKSAHRVYLEAYTSILLVDKEKLVLPSRPCGHHLTADRKYSVGNLLWSHCYVGRS